MQKFRIILLLSLFFFIAGCSDKPVNYPHGKHNSGQSIFFSSFDEQPKTLDPARSYTETESVFLAQIVEPPLQYQYLIRPYQLESLTATALPTIQFFDVNHTPLSSAAAKNTIAYTTYRISIQPGIYYQPHPAFAQDEQGKFINMTLTPAALTKIHTPQDFKALGTKELTADDYIYEIKRLAAPTTNSPLAGLLSENIVGFADYMESLKKQAKPQQFLDLRLYDFDGVKKIDKYTYEITVKGYYQQFIYWLATSFFAPVPWEVDKFYAQPALAAKNISFDTYPVGTGPYLMAKNNPNSEIILARNPNYHHGFYPTQGMPDDLAKGYLADAGQPLPFIDKFVFKLERENIPRWNKFLQGYFDSSGIASDNFDQAVQIDATGKPVLSAELQQKGIRLNTAIKPSVFYFGFNMLDPVVGGYDEKHIKLRQAISIAVNMEEFISIFLNGRGQVAQQPIPPDIFGYIAGEAGVNKAVYNWQDGKAIRKPLSYAKQLLAEAGYPNGINAKTGKPLVLTYDSAGGGSTEQRDQLDWLQKQFAQLGIQLIINDTDYNRFQEKLRTGNVQLYMAGWGADYPDPENFLFILYGPNSKVSSGGENINNYNNPKFNALFEQMKNMPDDAARLAVIQQMDNLFQHDAPWFGAFNMDSYQLLHSWVKARKSNAMANNVLKYSKLVPEKRAELQKKWNQPHWVVLVGLVGLILLSILPFAIKYWRMQRKPPKKINL